MRVAESTHSGLSVRAIVSTRQDRSDLAPRSADAIVKEVVADHREWFEAIWRQIQEREAGDDATGSRSSVSVRAAYGARFFPVFEEDRDGNWYRLPTRVVVSIDGGSIDTRVVVSIDGGGIFARRHVRTRRPTRLGGLVKKKARAGDWEEIRGRRELLTVIGHTHPGLVEYIGLVHPEPPASTPSRSRDLAPRTLAVAFAYYGIRDVCTARKAARTVLAWLEKFDVQPDVEPAPPRGRSGICPACGHAKKSGHFLNCTEIGRSSPGALAIDAAGELSHRLAARKSRGGSLTAKEESILAHAEDDVRRVCERARTRLGRFEP